MNAFAVRIDEQSNHQSQANDEYVERTRRKCYEPERRQQYADENCCRGAFCHERITFSLPPQHTAERGIGLSSERPQFAARMSTPEGLSDRYMPYHQRESGPRHGCRPHLSDRGDWIAGHVPEPSVHHASSFDE